jgi:hypothetical protein
MSLARAKPQSLARNGLVTVSIVKRLRLTIPAGILES